MSSSKYANEALNLVTDKFQWIIKKSEKFPMGDLAAKTLAHEIAVTLSTAFAQHGHAATSVPPMLLSCAAELRDKRAPNGKLKGLPDWAIISNDDSCISGHLLFNKTIGYTCPIPLVSPPTVTTPLPTHPTPAPAAQASNPARAAVASALFPITTPAPPPPNPVSKPFNLLIPGNKHKAPTSELDDNEEEPAPRPAKCPVSKSSSRGWASSSSGELTPGRESYICEGIPTILMPLQKTNQTESNTTHAVMAPAAAKPGVAAVKTPGSLQCLFSDQCKRFIKLDVACVVVAAKKADEDAEGNDDLQPEADVPKAAVPAAPVNAVPKAVAPAALVNNEVDMSVAPGDHAPMDITAPDAPPVEQPTLFDVIRMIEALRTRLEGMVTRSSDRAEALHEDMVGRMSTLDEEWNKRFAAMEAKI
ncbi:hypothetical protein EV424DRAFT_1351275 [Suillus variegatus]|nr:hypothetical protein EV424DRAFT_1351275 [Suillus variegatus]